MSSGMEGLEALARLFPIALSDTGQARRVANFLLAWHNSAENGGWDPVDLWNLDGAIADDILRALQLLRTEHKYPDALGFHSEIEAVWKRWRSAQTMPQSAANKERR